MAGERTDKGEVIGVTGFIGSGKSMVSRFLARSLACPYLDADKVARDLMMPGQQGWLVVKEYNRKYIMADGQLNRLLLRNDIFSDHQVKDAIDSLIHPLVKGKLEELLGPKPCARAVVEVPLLFEAGWDEFFARIILVYAEKNTCLKRVMERDMVGVAQAEQSYLCQMAATEKIKRADHVIDNGGPWWNTQLQIVHLVDILTGEPG